MSYVCIYNGQGVGPISLEQTEKSLKMLLNEKYSVIQLDQSYFQRFDSDYKGLFYPGGNGFTYTHTITESSAQKVNDWVNQGGAVYGSCAGAYYLSRETLHNDKYFFGNKHPLFAGTCTYPAYPGFVANSFIGSVASEIEICASEGKKIKVLCNGGPKINCIDSTAQKVLANYADIEGNPAAVIQTGPGDRVVLSAVHPEVDSSDLLTKYPGNENLQGVDNILRDYKDANQAFFKSLCESIGLETRMDLEIPST